MPSRMSMPCAMQCAYEMTSDGPSYASASRNARNVCCGSAPIATRATYTLPYAMACNARSFFGVVLPPAANLATADSGVALDICPPVLE